jgi:acetoin utilization protein AcuB
MDDCPVRGGPMKRVSDAMKSPVVTAKPGDKLGSLLAFVSTRKIGHFPVVEDGKVVGIVTDRDLRLAATHPAVYDLLLDLLASLDRGSVEEIMGREVITVTPDTSVARAAQLMLERKIGCLPVVSDDGRLVGIVTTTDVMAAFAAQNG